MPQLGAFNFSGGVAVSPEFAALLFGLVVYTAAFIAEIVRSGIQGVSRGQGEAARRSGLRRGQVLRLVVLPQAVRIIVPPMTSEYLNLDQEQLARRRHRLSRADVDHQHHPQPDRPGGRGDHADRWPSISALSLSISLLMNWYNRRVALVER